MIGKELLDEVMGDLPALEDGKNVCLALSGGLDSTTLVYILVKKYGKERVKTLSFDFGQRHSIELDMASITTKLLDIEHHTYALDYLKEISKSVSSLIEGSELKPKTAEENAGDPQVSTYVPWRNAQFAMITAAFAEANNCSYILQATNQVDCYGYFDTTTDFRDALNNIFQLNRQNPLTLLTPFVEMYKDEELQIAKALSEEHGYNILKNTWSCYNGSVEEYNFKECGKCNTCEEKLLGYIQADFTDDEITDKFNLSVTEVNKLRSQIN
jgi:7-cyano-7-deazaguanine synthase